MQQSLLYYIYTHTHREKKSLGTLIASSSSSKGKTPKLVWPQKLELRMASSSTSSSGLTFKLHPLVIVNISDHYTRVKSQMQQPSNNSNSNSNDRVYGCVIGVQRGRTVEIFNSFELLYDESTHSLDRTFLEKKQELYKKVFPHFYILGWYSTGTDAHESDMLIHKAVSLSSLLFSIYLSINFIFLCNNGEIRVAFIKRVIN